METSSILCHHLVTCSVAAQTTQTLDSWTLWVSRITPSSSIWFTVSLGYKYDYCTEIHLVHVVNVSANVGAVCTPGWMDAKTCTSSTDGMSGRLQESWSHCHWLDSCIRIHTANLRTVHLTSTLAGCMLAEEVNKLPGVVFGSESPLGCRFNIIEIKYIHTSDDIIDAVHCFVCNGCNWSGTDSEHATLWLYLCLGRHFDLVTSTF